MSAFAAFGQVISLHVLDFGSVRLSGHKRDSGIMGFLITTDQGRHVLIDTGPPAPALAAATSDTRRTAPGRTAQGKTATKQTAAETAAPGQAGPAGPAALFRPAPHSAGDAATLSLLRADPEASLAGQLALLDLTPRDIDLTILTHTHPDRTGGLAALAHVPLLVGAAEEARLAPRAGRPREITGITGDTEICDGLILIPTPGHTPGHLSVLLLLPQTGPAILTGHALERFDQLMNGFHGVEDESAANRSADRLLALAQQGAELIIYGQCPGQWQQLRRAPRGYL